MASTTVSLCILFMIITKVVGEDIQSMMMSLMPGSTFECANTTCLPFDNITTSNIRSCQLACLTQSQCTAATFYESTFDCELFDNTVNQNGNMLADVDATSMDAISGTRFSSVHFYTVETVTGHRFSLTSTHYVRVPYFEYLSASQLTLNHSLYVIDKTTGNIREARIRSIKIEKKQGAFNPLTLHGTLLVNGIFASSYTRAFGWSHETFQNMATPFRFLYYLTKYLGIHQAIWTNNDEYVWAAKPFLYLDKLNYYIPFISTIIFAIPIALAIYTSISSEQQKQQAEKKQQFDFEQSRELRQQSLYDGFLNNIYKLDKDGYLNDTKNPWAFANAYYRAAHRQWDTIRKADVIQFLKEKQLIGRNNCSNGCRTTKLDDIIRLNELSFDNVRLTSETGVLNKLNLQCISFDQISMSNGEFSSVNLNGASFDGARLDKVKFDGSSLLCVSFNGANLAGAHFSNSDLSGAKITEDQINQASFHNVTMPNGKNSEIISSMTTKKPVTQITTKMSTTTSPTSTPSTTTTTMSSSTTTTATTTSSSSSSSSSSTTTTSTSTTTSSTSTSTSTTSTSTSTTTSTTSSIAAAIEATSSTSVAIDATSAATNITYNLFLNETTYPVGTKPEAVAVADVNSDNKPDIIVANYVSNTVSVLLNEGSGIFNAQTTYLVGSSPYSVAVVDVNSDSKSDIIVTNSNSDNVSVLLNAGNGTFNTSATYSVGSSPYSIAVVDVNGDNKSDIIVVNSGSNNVGVLLNAGSGTFNIQITYAVSSGPRSVAVVDVNSDYKPDIIVANSRSNTVGVLLNAGNGIFDNQTIYPVGTFPWSVAVTDVNNDNKPDIIVAKFASSNVGVLLHC
ncbi:unnamed protein product [Adineta steineri]|uniref:Apple domain-containing protein n=1 Tax=Adineta steineri TaxID=433720 RepID=A0A819I330_9BILA|nr:unnamed protein product [Adineta steineri]